VFRITPGQAPTTLLQAVQTAPETRDVPMLTYEGLPKEVKDEVRQSLFTAQNRRCAYCEERIAGDADSTKIEHFHPQKHKEEATTACVERTGLSKASILRADVTWGNLLLCCLGHQGSGSAGQCCDTKKGNTDICNSSYNPRNIAGNRISLVSISNDGVATAAYYPGDQPSAQHVIDKVLNLNLRRLKDNRSRLYREYLSRFRQAIENDLNKTPKADLRKRFSDKARQDIEEEGALYPSTLASIAAFIERAGPR
jgi:hypothetical protein